MSGAGGTAPFFVPEIICELKSSRAFAFVGWTRPHQRHSPSCGNYCGISSTIWETLPMLCHVVSFKAKSTSSLSVLKKDQEMFALFWPFCLWIDLSSIVELFYLGTDNHRLEFKLL